MNAIHIPCNMHALLANIMRCIQWRHTMHCMCSIPIQDPCIRQPLGVSRMLRLSVNSLLLSRTYIYIYRKHAGWYTHKTTISSKFNWCCNDQLVLGVRAARLELNSTGPITVQALAMMARAHFKWLTNVQQFNKHCIRKIQSDFYQLSCS